MEYDFTLRWLDPFGSWGDHNEPYFHGQYMQSGMRMDTGLCNRLFHWEIGYELLKLSKQDNIQILVQKKIWPELELLELPSTTGISLTDSYAEFQSKFEYDTLYMKSIFDLTNKDVYLAKPITETKLMSILKNKNFSMKSGRHWYCDFGYHSLSSIYNKMNQTLADTNVTFDIGFRPINKIRLKHTYIQEIISQKFPKFVGIHIRRGNGVLIHDDEIDVEENWEIKDEFKKWRKENVKDLDNLYRFYPDESYYKIIDAILKINPKQEFYISHDMPDVFLQPFYDRYGKKIHSKIESRHFYQNFYTNAGLNVSFLKNYANAIDNVTDLFSLSYCGFIIGYPSSSWTQFATSYKMRPWHDPTENLTTILMGYKDAFKITNGNSLL